MYKLEKFDGKSMNVPNHENLMENCVHQMYRQSRLVEKFDFVKNTDSLDLLRNLILLKIQNCENSMENYVH